MKTRPAVFQPPNKEQIAKAIIASSAKEPGYKARCEAKKELEEIFSKSKFCMLQIDSPKSDPKIIIWLSQDEESKLPEIVQFLSYQKGVEITDAIRFNGVIVSPQINRTAKAQKRISLSPEQIQEITNKSCSEIREILSHTPCLVVCHPSKKQPLITIFIKPEDMDFKQHMVQRLKSNGCTEYGDNLMYYGIVVKITPDVAGSYCK